MAIQSNNKNFGSNRTINYIGKDFQQLRQNLIDYTKTYFPNIYADFNESSPGMVFIEMAAFIGDVLAYYQDAQLKESLLIHASERKNVMAIAQAMGYKPKISTPAVCNLTVYQLVPSTGNGINNKPDSKYFLKIKDGMQVVSTSNSNIVFRTTDYVDFASDKDREISIYSRDQNTGEPVFYLVTKKVKAISAKEVSTTISFAANATTALTDAGKHYYSTSASNLTLTLANNTSVGWAVGTTLTIINQGTGVITIAQGSGVSMYFAGNSTAANRSLSTYGLATLINVGANTWFINGSGVY